VKVVNRSFVCPVGGPESISAWTPFSRARFGSQVSGYGVTLPTALDAVVITMWSLAVVTIIAWPTVTNSAQKRLEWLSNQAAMQGTGRSTSIQFDWLLSAVVLCVFGSSAWAGATLDQCAVSTVLRMQDSWSGKHIWVASSPFTNAVFVKYASMCVRVVQLVACTR
jgi:hypothetical protein